MIEEARRLALLQKQRELKAAGIDFVIEKKLKGVDYNVEVPFERTAPAFVFRTGKEEDPKPNLQLGKITLQMLEGPRRDEDEQAKRRVDARKIKKLKDRDLPSTYDKLVKLTDPMHQARSKLSLSQPQITDKDLEGMAKLNSMQAEQTVEGGMNAATRALVGNYSVRGATPTPMRTPRYENSVMREAQNALAMMQAQTPLIGGQNAPMTGTNLTGLTPKTKFPPSTPNPLAGRSIRGPTPARAPTGEGMFATPRNDELRLNEERNWEGSSVAPYDGASVNQEELVALQRKQRMEQLRSGLDLMPQPKNEYQIEVPDLEEEDHRAKEKLPDAEDVDQATLKRRKEEQAERFMERSKTVQRNLPRPTQLNEKSFHFDAEKRKFTDPLEEEAAYLIHKELRALVVSDMVEGVQKGTVIPAQILEEAARFERIPRKEVAKAEALLNEESAAMREDITQAELEELFSSVWDKCLDSIVYDPESRGFVLAQGDEAQIKFRKRLFDLKKGILAKEEAKAKAAEDKTKILVGGYSKVVERLTRELNELVNQRDTLGLSLEAFRALKQHESQMLVYRLEEAQRFLDSQMQKEDRLQRHYQSLLDKRKMIDEDDN
eukprot:TRINITY_DN2890_c0_g1_i10.p1 TRINITY_DN2890_c0_g1~~TRINITY_DN2890_c0_g1_i10.p1  ORF type:complete len:605 (+),score=188.83 TRINITY_DN2890_c0_g1_i10:351-2165(+)